MLEFSDAPYRFFEARPSSALIRLGRGINRSVILPGRNHRIRELRISGEVEALQDAKARGERLMFVINHPSHSDPQTLTEVHRRLGIESCFMAAYDVFLRSSLAAWCMQRMGHFSIDREGADRKAMAAAIATLKEGRFALNIFSEGNVFLTNDRLAPFMDGAAFIALKALSTMDGMPLKIVPVSLKFTHLRAPREAVTERMIQLAKDSGYRFPPGISDTPVDAVLGLGYHIIRGFLAEHGFREEMCTGDRPLFEILREFTGGLTGKLEEELEIDSLPGAEFASRIAKVRSCVHQLRMESGRQSHPGIADRAILALRVHGYLEPYLTARPTIDRYDETVERISEDFYSRAMPRTGPRRALACIHSPVDPAVFLDAAGGKMRNAVGPLTAELQRAVQSGIDSLNEANDALGGSML